MDVYALWALSPEITIVVVVGSALALVAGVVVGLVRARRREALAAAAEASGGATPPPLVDGAEVVLAGIVRPFDDQDVAVTVSITQVGTEMKHKDATWSHAWTEVDRQTSVASFRLELPTGELVVVEPPANVDVADALDRTVQIDRTRRVRSAALVAGERIFARGRLVRAGDPGAGGVYRDAQRGWTLEPAGGRMLLSTEPLGAGLRRRAAFHRKAAWLALALLVITQASFSLFYARLAGRTEDAIVTALAHTSGPRNGNDEVTVRGETVAVTRRDYLRLREGMTVPIRYATAKNWDLGASPTIRLWHGGAVVVAVIAFWIVYRSRRRSSRPWFRRKLDETRAGRLDHGASPNSKASAAR